MEEAVTEQVHCGPRHDSGQWTGTELVQEAEERILGDLVNALLAEGILDQEGRGGIVDTALVGLEISAHALKHWAQEEIKAYRWWSHRQDGHYLVFPVRSAVIQPYRYVTGGGVYEVKAARQGQVNGLTRLGPADILKQVTDVLYPSIGHKTEQNKENGVTRLMKLLQLTLEQTRWSLENPPAPNGSPASEAYPWLTNLAELERWAALRDRPFHPVAKAKGGWTRADYDNYSAESGRPITLQWIAVQRRHLLYGGGLREQELASVTHPAELLLREEERRQVDEAMQRLGLPAEHYAALPVHPWQLAAVLPHMLPKELEERLCVPLDVAAGVYYATSSARSLAPESGGAAHVKLPLGIVSLGAVRYLPAVHMINGERGQRLLEQARQLDPVLKERLYLCDETNWWAYLQEDGDYFADPPRHLSALVRKYPEEILDTEGAALVPMSALAVHGPNGRHVLDAWMGWKGVAESKTLVEILFGELCLHFFHLALRLFRLGVMPEIHGQNVVLLLKRGEVSGLLLRDHDSVRLHLPWMKEHGLSDPCYKMKPGYPNSLYNETPQKLLYYLQTLGIQVNLYSILESVAARYGMEERELWNVLKDSLIQAIELAGLSSEIKILVEEALFGKPSWPWKNLIKPLLEQEGIPSGSMPSGAGESVNPFHRLS